MFGWSIIVTFRLALWSVILPQCTICRRWLSVPRCLYAKSSNCLKLETTMMSCIWSGSAWAVNWPVILPKDWNRSVCRGLLVRLSDVYSYIWFVLFRRIYSFPFRRILNVTANRYVLGIVGSWRDLLKLIADIGIKPKNVNHMHFLRVIEWCPGEIESFKLFLIQ